MTDVGVKSSRLPFAGAGVYLQFRLSKLNDHQYFESTIFVLKFMTFVCKVP